MATFLPIPMLRGVVIAAGVLAATAAAAQPSLVDIVKRGDLAAARAALEARQSADSVDPEGTSALHWAALQDRPDFVEVLLRFRADPNAKNRYGVRPLSVACENGNPAIVDALLKAGA